MPLRRCLLTALFVAAALTIPSAGAAPAPVALGDGTSVVLTGHGFGHGIGLSQVGAYGYAVHFGWTSDQILAHYYGGTTQSSSDPNQALTVRLTAVDNDPVTAVIHDGGGLATSVTGGDQFRSAAAVEVAPGSYNLYVRADAVSCPGATTAGELEVAGTPWVKKASGVTSVEFFAAGVDAATAPVASLLGVCERLGTDQFDSAIRARYYRGSIRALNGTAGENRTVNSAPLDRYVQGVVPREMPAAWGLDGSGAGMNALRAQAVAARSYALAQNRYSYAKTCDTQSCQVYGGAGYRAAVNPEHGGPTPIIATESSLANQATTDTAGSVLVAGGKVVSTQYSASSGGYTNDAGSFPAVVDDGDQYSPLPNRHTWSATLAVATIEAVYPQIGSLQQLIVTARNGLGEDGGRVRSMNIVGTLATVKVTGTQFQSAFGLRSDWFSLSLASPSPLPLACDGRTVPPVTPSPAPAPARFAPVTLARILDTRHGLGTVAVPLAANCAMALTVMGTGGVPATGVAAVAINVTATQAAAPGFLTVYPCGVSPPSTSTVNYAAGEHVANMAQVRVGTDGQICITTMSKVDVVVDILGWYGASATSGYAALPPTRVLDTRYGLGIGGQRQAIAAGAVAEVTVAGAAGVPADAAGVMLNVTDTESDADGYLTVFPCGGAVPPSSTLNYRAGRDVANQAVAGIGTNGRVCVNSFATSHAVADVLGWFGPRATAAYVPLTPSRVLDTRLPNAVFSGRVPAGGVVALPIAGQGGIPATAGAVVLNAVVLNITVDQPSGPGFVTAFPCGGAPPVASNLNYAAGQVVANLTTVPVPITGQVCLYTWAATDLVVDVSGYFTS